MKYEIVGYMICSKTNKRGKIYKYFGTAFNFFNKWKVLSPYWKEYRVIPVYINLNDLK